MTMTLGTLIEVTDNLYKNMSDNASVHYIKPDVKNFDDNDNLLGVDDLYSWRGDYSHLCLPAKHTDDWLGVEQFLCRLRGAVGMKFTGYKGGEFEMTENTPVWRSNHCNSDNTHGITHLTIESYGSSIVIHTKVMNTIDFFQ